VSKQLRLISHPFHNGLEGVDMGAGPAIRTIGRVALGQ
jgi:hypothetical protein